MLNNSVELLKKDFDEISKILNTNKPQPSLQNNFDRTYKKVLLLSAASYFEYEITEILKSCAKHKDKMIAEFCKKIKERKYFKLFKWENYAKNEDYGELINAFKINEKDNILGSTKAFLEIGHFRNELVHNDFARYQLEKTTEEIYNLFRQAEKFIEYLRCFLTE
ncbi:MAG: HEPN domain-containing protein [Fibromonadales bacterium]|nr:HEPN domain-containing protein [Fibromonadales bacterium]